MSSSRLSRLVFVASVIQLTTSQTLESLILGGQIAQSLGIIPTISSLPSPAVDSLQLVNSGSLSEAVLGTLNNAGLNEGSVLSQAVEALRPARNVAYYPSSTLPANYGSTNVLGADNSYKSLGYPVANSAVKVGTGGFNSVSNVANIANGNLANGNFNNGNQVNGLANINANVANTLANINQRSQTVASATNKLNAAVSTQEKPRKPLGSNVVNFPLTVSSGNSDVPLGLQVAANNLEIGGSVAINGRMPFNGVVSVNGNVPTDGKGRVSQYFGDKKPSCIV